MKGVSSWRGSDWFVAWGRSVRVGAIFFDFSWLFCLMIWHNRLLCDTLFRARELNALKFVFELKMLIIITSSLRNTRMTHITVEQWATFDFLNLDIFEHLVSISSCSKNPLNSDLNGKNCLLINWERFDFLAIIFVQGSSFWLELHRTGYVIRQKILSYETSRSVSPIPPYQCPKLTFNLNQSFNF